MLDREGDILIVRGIWKEPESLRMIPLVLGAVGDFSQPGTGHRDSQTSIFLGEGPCSAMLQISSGWENIAKKSFLSEILVPQFFSL